MVSKVYLPMLEVSCVGLMVVLFSGSVLIGSILISPSVLGSTFTKLENKNF